MAQGLTQVNDENVRRRPVESSGEHREHMHKISGGEVRLEPVRRFDLAMGRAGVDLNSSRRGVEILERLPLMCSKRGVRTSGQNLLDRGAWRSV